MRARDAHRLLPHERHSTRFADCAHCSSGAFQSSVPATVQLRGHATVAMVLPMASCSICTLQLKPRTLANLWYCERCNAEFAPCVSCAAIASRSERGMRSCQNRTCMLFDVPLSPCPACRAFSLRDPAEVESCQNANCVATGTVLHKPKIDAPARDDQPTVDVRPGRPLGTDLGMLEEFAEMVEAARAGEHTPRARQQQ